MSQVATMRALSCCSLRSSMGTPCVSMKLQRGANATRRQGLLRPRTTSEASASRFKSTSAPPSRQQSTAFASAPSAASSSSSMTHQVTRPALFKQMRDSLQNFLLKPRTVPVPRWISPHHYTVTFSELCGHASFILVAVSYAMDDFLELRIIAVAGSTAMLFFHVLSSPWTSTVVAL
jgi:hypothetical protein